MKVQTERAVFWWVMIAALAAFWVMVGYTCSHANSVKLGWNANTETDLAKYTLYRNDQKVADIVAPEGGGAIPTTYTDEDLAPGWYTYELTATDTSDNESLRSNKTKEVPAIEWTIQVIGEIPVQ